MEPRGERVNNYWSTAESGLRAWRWRRGQAMEFSVELEPPTKKSKKSTRMRARDALLSAIADDALAQHAKKKGAWPKPNAGIALDLILFSDARNGARVDSICKWLLDELNGQIYADDRQVKLLFARVSRPLRALKGAEVEAVPPLELSMDSNDGTSESKENEKPVLHLTAQTRTHVMADLAALADLDERWDPFADTTSASIADSLRESTVTYLSNFDPQDPADAEEHKLLSAQLNSHDQEQAQAFVDRTFATLFTEPPARGTGVWRRTLDRFVHAPYLFKLGALPGHGESAQFKEDLVAMLEERRAAHPGLFPMTSTSGLSMILFEDPKSGKDLDNLIRTVIPTVLEVLEPQSRDLPGWIAAELDPASRSSDISFIEVAAVPAALVGQPAGSVYFGLSSGNRYDSWWMKAAKHVAEALKAASR